MKITAVRTFPTSIPLPSAISAAGYEIRARDYHFVRVDTDAGISGWGFTLGRGADVSRVIDRNLTPLLLGENPLENERIWNKLYKSTLFYGQKGMVLRAISMIDIALWDIKGRAANLPLADLVGGNSGRVPVNAVGGYYRDGVTDECLYEEIRSLADAGYWGVKIAAGAAASDVDLQRLRTCRRAIGPEGRLMADVNWCWDDVKTAIRTARTWEEFRLHWIEEPFPPENLRARREFRAAVDVPLALGDEQYGRWTFRSWIENSAVDILRPDATVVGGITEYLKISALASCFDLPLAPHYYPDVHVHLAAAQPWTICVEAFDRRAGIDSFHLVRKNALEAVDGWMKPPDEAGLGLVLDMEALERYAA